VGSFATVPTFVVEASPLISFLKIDRFDLLEILDKPLVCTDFVRAEVKRPRERLDEILTIGRLNEIPLQDPSLLLEVETLYGRGLGRGEASSIVFAQSKGYGLIIDDKRARKIAVSRNVTLISTTEIVVLNIQKGNITLAEADGFIEAWKDLGEFPVVVKSFSEVMS
jgi:predicted nucleic acid-binding protein